MSYELRPARPDDFEFVFRLNETNFRAYVERVRGWDEKTERQDMENVFEPTVDEIIVIDGRDAGVIGVDRSGSELHLRHIELLPEYQGRGIGTDVIRNLLHEARERKSPSLCRLQFRAAGETDSKYLMAARQDGFSLS